MRTYRLIALLTTLAVAATAIVACADDARTNADLVQEVRAAEIAFARTMADRDHAAFTSFLDDETVFFNGDTEMRGKQAVADAWSGFYQGEAAPFSWAPDAVTVLDSGTLGLSSGGVFDAEGNRIGTFNSVWRLGDDGTWKVIFDRGCP